MMKPLKTLALGAALTGMAGLPALAGGMQEPVIETPVVAPAPVIQANQGGDWTGGYVGAQLGYADASTGGVDGSGETYGLRAGYDWDLGGWVVGAGLDWDKTNADFGAGPDNLDSIARLKLRAGADLGRTLVYATGGLAHAEATIGGTDVSDDGWFGGIGAEYAINNQWTVGGEILSNQFDNFGGTGSRLNATTANVNANFRF